MVKSRPGAALLAISFFLFSTGFGLADGVGKTPKTRQQMCKLLIHATGFHTDQGKAGAAVFNSPEGWPDRSQESYVGGEIPKADGKATFKYQVPPGTYAIVVIDDVNENEKLDRNFLGIPKEGFGFANNPRVFLRAPSFKAASIKVTCPETETTIRMEYR